MLTKCSLRVAATSSSSNTSAAMTWHQWQDEYPMDRKIGRSWARASARVSGDHGYQSTGLWACSSRYVDPEPTRWFPSRRISAGVRAAGVGSGAASGVV